MTVDLDTLESPLAYLQVPLIFALQPQHLALDKFPEHQLIVTILIHLTPLFLNSLATLANFLQQRNSQLHQPQQHSKGSQTHRCFAK